MRAAQYAQGQLQDLLAVGRIQGTAAQFECANVAPLTTASAAFARTTAERSGRRAALVLLRDDGRGQRVNLVELQAPG